MKNVAIINSVSDRSTGKISSGLQNYLNDHGYNAFLCYGHGKRISGYNKYKIDLEIEHYWHALMARLLGRQGAYSILATKRLIYFLKKNKIDTVFGVGLHGYYLNEKILFDFISKQNIRFIYVMTEEYAYLGKCGYSDGCINYLSGCGKCPQLKTYPKSWFFDRTAQIYAMKKNAYTNLKKAVFVGPEYTIVSGKKSPLLAGCKTMIVDEAIDTTLYSPRNTKRLRQKLKIEDDKIIILCVAPSSYPRKGTKYFLKLAKLFVGNPKYVFIHVGFNGEKRDLPNNFIPVGYVSDQNKLAEYYSLGDLFVFPSLLDTMPNACLEALACGTPLLCFDISGMSYLGPSNIVTLVQAENVGQLKDVVNKVQKKSEKIVKECRNYALERYDNKYYFSKLVQAAVMLD
mgnify:CR=1 FL=1